MLLEALVIDVVVVGLTLTADCWPLTPSKPQAAMDLKTEILRVGGEVLRKAVVLVLHSQTDKGVRIETVGLWDSS